jgi:N-acetylglucosaminyldiphosphoundecaprenol N-acetyl-beta-D-mannosaminyltransferase
MEPAAFSFMGITVHALTADSLCSLVEETVAAKGKILLANHNLHSIYLCHHDSRMREFYRQAHYVNIDGMPVVWLGRLLGHPLQRENRLAAIDWLPQLLARLISVCGEERPRLFFLGAAEGTAEKAALHFKAALPGLQIMSHHGFFNSEPESADNRQVLQLINDFQPHLLVVGMGMPRQEHWILDNLEQLQVNVVTGQGGFFDLVAGVLPTPPRWLGSIGLEWLYRLASRPRRVWRRYLIEPWSLAGLLVKEWSMSRGRGC